MEQLATGPWDGFDKEGALGRVGGDLGLLKEIARVFLDDCPRLLEELREAAARSDFAAVERHAHTLKGSSANFGASRLVSAALRIEKMGRARSLKSINFLRPSPTWTRPWTRSRTELEALIAS